MPNTANAVRSVRQKIFRRLWCYKYFVPDGTKSIDNVALLFTTDPLEVLMKKFTRGLPFLLLFGLLAVTTQAQNSDLQRYQQAARNVTITRDNWGIAHVHGKTDANAVFGMIYAQAEDDFNRVETNYINSMGRLAEAEGESAIWRDLRMKLFIDPQAMKAEYEKTPAWLQKLMIAWADGLNFYLEKHPEVKPRVIKHFEPWMALTFSEGSIGGDIETINLTQLQAFYGTIMRPSH